MYDEKFKNIQTIINAKTGEITVTISYMIADGYQKKSKLTMARLKHYCSEHDELVFELFEA